MGRIAVLTSERDEAKARCRELSARLTLSDREKEVLRGEDDGCVRVGMLHPIVERVFGGVL